MQHPFATINIPKLKQQIRRVRIACIAAIEIGDCRAVARLTCEAARLKNCLSLVYSM